MLALIFGLSLLFAVENCVTNGSQECVSSYQSAIMTGDGDKSHNYVQEMKSNGHNPNHKNAGYDLNAKIDGGELVGTFLAGDKNDKNKAGKIGAY